MWPLGSACGWAGRSEPWWPSVEVSDRSVPAAAAGPAAAPARLERPLPLPQHKPAAEGTLLVTHPTTHPPTHLERLLILVQHLCLVPQQPAPRTPAGGAQRAARRPQQRPLVQAHRSERVLAQRKACVVEAAAPGEAGRSRPASRQGGPMPAVGRCSRCGGPQQRQCSPEHQQPSQQARHAVQVQRAQRAQRAQRTHRTSSPARRCPAPHSCRHSGERYWRAGRGEEGLEARDGGLQHSLGPQRSPSATQAAAHGGHSGGRRAGSRVVHLLAGGHRRRRHNLQRLLIAVHDAHLQAQVQAVGCGARGRVMKKEAGAGRRPGGDREGSSAARSCC